MITRSHLIAPIIGSALMLGPIGHAAGTGQIKGSILDPAGKPVSGAVVALRVRPPDNGAAVSEYFDKDVNTDERGAFVISGVPPGKYAVCPSAADPSLLSPCTWDGEPTVVLANGQSLTMPPIQLKRGVDLYVRVNDRSGKRAAMEGKVAGASLFLAVRSPAGMIVHIPQATADGRGFDHHLFVPADVDLPFVAYSRMYAMTAGDGTAIDQQAGLSKLVHIGAAEGQHQEVINIK